MLKKLAVLAGSGLLLILIIFFHNLYGDRYQFDRVVVDSGITTFDLVSKLNDQLDVDIDYSTFRLVQKVYGFQIVAGTYDFEDPVSLVDFARTLDEGDALYHGEKLVIPEGFSNKKIANLIDSLGIENLSSVAFLELVSAHEGYLFPNTYYVDDSTSATDLVNTMLAEFEKRTNEFDPELNIDEVILASIIEREVATAKDRRMVADILHRRLKSDMRLQVDATLNYYLDKDSSELTKYDLEENHPFNTYVNVGLPPHPIANPGLDSLRSVRDPIKNNYLYYLSDSDSNIYYAADLEGHIANRQKYLNQ